MVLVDTSVWIDHFKKGNASLEKLLLDVEVACHPFIIGELACGNLKNSNEILTLLHSLPMAPIVEHDEILYFIESNNLMGIGIGLIDVHLLASAHLTHAYLWTMDKKLLNASDALGISYTGRR
ncbi:MAG TPA: type II toxin-antitoxin system VapC family toxin [Deltaproteobacteria bacterium]|nr:type II toxin-antitoxin system VapC family toxin [Deltaproteobacteria bacterium]HQI02784.1 type II toxin-antitoxin system VapC family toxin [Deltaproteobacteria bacterium]HQJ09340.1 type II toxin-antitoxin system VapC family toxin [Deltaproteobacteria bacterium]